MRPADIKPGRYPPLCLNAFLSPSTASREDLRTLLISGEHLSESPTQLPKSGRCSRFSCISSRKSFYNLQKNFI